MLSKNCLVIFMVSFLVAGFFFLSTPEEGFPGTAVLGCCVTNGGQCNGPGQQCGTEGASCQRENDPVDPSGPCSILCNTNTGPPWNGCFVPGETCFQVETNVASCQPIGCCQIAQGDCFETSEGTCDVSGFTYLGDGDCIPQFMEQCTPLPPTGCCVVDDMCTNDVSQPDCAGEFVPDTTCASDTSCTEVPPIEGCCQVDSEECNDFNNQQCAGEGDFFPGGTCQEVPDDGSFCEPPPQGCCVLGVNNCIITTESSCSNQTGDYQGNETSCSGIPECNVRPPAIPGITPVGFVALALFLLGAGAYGIWRKKIYKTGF